MSAEYYDSMTKLHRAAVESGAVYMATRTVDIRRDPSLPENRVDAAYYYFDVDMRAVAVWSIPAGSGQTIDPPLAAGEIDEKELRYRIDLRGREER